jgi:exopolysaccharide biosynthesis polyprenyl glycosylphosphotransferase
MQLYPTERIIALAHGPDRRAAARRWPTMPALSRRAQRRALRLVLLVGDALMLVLAHALAYWLRFDLEVALYPEVTPSLGFYVGLMALLTPLWLCLFAVFKLYDFRQLIDGTAEYANAFNACTVGTMLLVIVDAFVDTFIVARGWLVATWLLSILLVCGARFWLRRAVYALRRRGYFVAPAAIVGTNGEALAIAEQLASWASSGLFVVGHMHDTEPASERGLPVLGSLDDIEDVVQQHGIEELIVATTALRRDELLSLFERVDALSGVELRFSSGLFEVLTTDVQVKTVGFVPLMSLRKLRLSPAELAMKTVLDYGICLAALVPLLPAFATIALLIVLDSPGPVFYRRRVLGVGGKEFDAFKFRTMFVNGGEILARSPTHLAQLRADHKLKNDPRITAVGRWLRRYSLDELPQLLNVLLGQMSLVGPRMLTREETARYGRLRLNLLTVKPGLTGLWQVSGRSELSYEERVRLDMHYIRNYTIWRDLEILFVQTLPAILRGRGAY